MPCNLCYHAAALKKLKRLNFYLHIFIYLCKFLQPNDYSLGGLHLGALYKGWGLRLIYDSFILLMRLGPVNVCGPWAAYWLHPSPWKHLSDSISCFFLCWVGLFAICARHPAIKLHYEPKAAPKAHATEKLRHLRMIVNIPWRQPPSGSIFARVYGLWRSYPVGWLPRHKRGFGDLSGGEMTLLWVPSCYGNFVSRRGTGNFPLLPPKGLDILFYFVWNLF